jgi:hypothetical protein
MQCQVQQKSKPRSCGFNLALTKAVRLSKSQHFDWRMFHERTQTFIWGFIIAMSITTLAFILTPLMQAATPRSGTLNDSSTKLTYTGTTATVNPATFDPTTCQTAGYCDVFTLTLNVSSHFVPRIPTSASTFSLNGWETPMSSICMITSAVILSLLRQTVL